MDGWPTAQKSIIKKGKWKILQSGLNPSDKQLETAQEGERIPVKPERGQSFWEEKNAAIKQSRMQAFQHLINRPWVVCPNSRPYTTSKAPLQREVTEKTTETRGTKDRPHHNEGELQKAQTTPAPTERNSKPFY